MGRSISNLTPNFNTSSVIGNYVDIPLFEEVDLITNYSDSNSPSFPDVVYSPSSFGGKIFNRNLSVSSYDQYVGSAVFDYFKIGNIVFGHQANYGYSYYNKHLYSNDGGETWSLVSIIANDISGWNNDCFASDGSKFVTILHQDLGLKTKCLTSTDGLSWTINANVDDFGSVSRDSLIYNGSVFCVLSGSSVFISSTGSGTWTQVGVPQISNGVGFVHGTTIGYIDSYRIIYSTDNGSTWTTVSNFPAGYSPGLYQSGGNKNYYMSNGNIFFLYFSKTTILNDVQYHDNALYSTTDFLNWTRRINGSNYSSGTSDEIGVLDNNFVMFSRLNTNFSKTYVLLFSKDGIKWYSRGLTSYEFSFGTMLGSNFKTNNNLIRIVSNFSNLTYYPDARICGFVKHI